ncbi:MAG: hypothetical protein JNK76_03595 [Planctomycetales bacterium]|nr:hypothetical protein [Planctomycetales bacterium]MBN8628670.1 hypothetical protein [Planctomycetota bacterium]
MSPNAAQPVVFARADLIVGFEVDAIIKFPRDLHAGDLPTDGVVRKVQMRGIAQVTRGELSDDVAATVVEVVDPVQRQGDLNGAAEFVVDVFDDPTERFDGLDSGTGGVLDGFADDVVVALAEHLNNFRQAARRRRT